MSKVILNNIDNSRNRRGIVLLVTLILLVVLATLGYTVTCRVSAQRRRSQYIVDYQAARYGCDSGVKFALATIETITPKLISRPNEPDFSDTFYMDELEYQELLDELAVQNGFGDSQVFDFPADTNDINDANADSEFSDFEAFGDINDMNGFGDFNEPNSLFIRGPYGAPWPLVAKATEFKIGDTTVKIEIEDENAKYPVGWMLMNDKKVEREVLAGFETFCEWMDVNDTQIYSIEDQLKEVAKLKPFKLEFKNVTKRSRVAPKSSRTRGRRKSSRSVGGRKYTTTKVSASKQAEQQAADFAKLINSPMIDSDVLARPTVISESRKESALKYMGMWGSTRVNVNTAPRHVLEAAFMFGGDADKIAAEVIQRRRIKPFKNIDELKSELLQYSESIRKCEKYITTVSSFFTVRVTATSGVAQTSAIIAIMKRGRKVSKIAVLSG